MTSRRDSKGMMGDLRSRATISVEEAAQILGISRLQAYELARAGELPGLLRLGRRRLRVAVPALLTFIGSDLDGSQ